MINADGAIFDLDGTLWDSAEGVCIAWNEIFRNHGLSYQCTPPEMHAQMGKLMHDIFASLLPDVEENELNIIEKEACDNEERTLERVGGMLYPKLEETLSELSKRMPLFIVSNCQSGYIECFFAAHGLGKYFKDIECSGNTGLTKDQNIRLIAERNHLSCPVYIGDTALDGKSARKAGVPFIHAAYGFGETADKDASIDSISEILDII